MQSAYHRRALRTGSRRRGVRLERLKTAGRATDPLIGFLNLVSSVSIRGQNSFLQPQIDTDFWSLPAASGRVHIIDDVCQRYGAGEHKRPLPVDSRQRAGAEAHRHHVALPIAPGEAALATIPERAAVIAQNLVEGKAKVTVGRSALDQVAFDDAGHDRAVCQADVVQAGEVELDERLPAGLPHLKVRLAGELDRPVAALGRRASRRHSECHYSKGCI